MVDPKKYIRFLFEQKNIPIPDKRNKLFEEFASKPENIEAVNIIYENQKILMDKWRITSRINEVKEAQIIIPNATVNKKYEAVLDFIKMGLNDLILVEFDGLEQYGLVYEDETIKGLPLQSGDFKILMRFKIEGELETAALNEKRISLVINADPKSLWKNIPSTKTESNFWKPDDVSETAAIGDRQIVVSSKRGRSHANVGSFRDDDYAFKHFENTGWSIVCVADGAGSAPLARQGSKIACDEIVRFFEEKLDAEADRNFTEIITAYHTLNNSGEKIVEKSIEEIINEDTTAEVVVDENGNLIEVAATETAEPKNDLEEIQKKITLLLYNNLGKAAFSAHKKLEAFAAAQGCALKDLHSTLIFALYKKYDFGYAIFTFGVGDCPIGLLNKDCTEIKLMNWLDVGEFGGGTRFITMPEIFSSDKFTTRFGFKLIEDFSYLMLMTDGIYDPKFVVEASLEKIEKWNEFLADLAGNNEEKITVEFSKDNTEIANQLSTWMDFWSPGNHDDRTLAIVF
jgi:serine/threonine protein phosphatase PrpC